VPLLELGRNIPGLNVKKIYKNSSVVDPDSMGTLDPYPDPGEQKLPTNEVLDVLFEG
jgi:hypothetical protein